MNQETIVRETVQAFCNAWFVQQNAEGAVSLLADGVSFHGTGYNEIAQGKDRMAEYIRRDILEMQSPFSCKLVNLRGESIVEHVYSLSGDMTLINPTYTWRLRGFFIMQEIGGDWLVRSLHFAEPGKSQRGEEHYPQALVVETIQHQRLEFLSQSLAGGMMGGYIDNNFPFYFINRRMLDYLGYEYESDFVSDIEGYVSNCMHPDDRSTVDEAVSLQLAGHDEYVVEYRMKKKDGTYIWVHDVGQKITAEDGRPAISSVCIDITEQKKAQSEVLHLYNNIPGGVFRCRFDEDYTVLDANDGLFEFIGYTREEFKDMGSRMASVIYPDDLAVMTDKLNAQLQHGNRIHNENRLVCKDGSIKWISINAQLFREGKESYFYCVFVDITDERRLRQQAQEHYSQELSNYSRLSSVKGSIQGRYDLTLNRIDSYVCTSGVTDVPLNITYDEAIEQFANSAIDAGYGEKIRRTLARDKVCNDYFTGIVDYHFDFFCLPGNGSSYWCSASFRSAQNPDTGSIMLFFYTTDITESKMQEQMLSRIADLDYDILADVDIALDTYRIISLRNEYRHLIPPQGLFQSIVRTIADKTMEPDAGEHLLQSLDYEYVKEQLYGHDSYSFVIELCNSMGDRAVKRVQVFYLNEELGRFCVASTDVTDVVRREQQQKEDLSAVLAAAEQANAAKTDFLSRMSHEIRTPMNAIIGMSAIAAKCIGEEERAANCISKIGISSRYLLGLINDILDMSRIESGKMLLKNEKIPTEEFLNGINSICYSQAAAKGVDYECILAPMMDSCYMGDSMKLQQVLVNILSNAIKFTGQGGKVTLSAEQLKKTKNHAELRFIVNDTGIGMSREYLPHMFEAFSQESTGTTALYGGTGLGLAISKNIVDLMGGAIAVRSIKGSGTEFTVDVKLGIVEGSELGRGQKKPSYNFSHLKTLVVDDDVIVCESAVATLCDMGIRADWVDSGHKAVERVRELWETHNNYDMILIDWKMPEMDGIETARQIRTIVGPDVTIIIITAYDWAAIEEEAKLAGINLLMDKPMFKSSLISAFQKALGVREETSQADLTVEFDFTGRRILLAEDNAINTEVAVMLLEDKGFAVETVENGLRALEKFNKSLEGYYSAVLMDIRMPVMDGLTAASNIRNLSNTDARTIPIIAMTANAFEDDIEKSRAAGMNAHLAKPIEPGRLYQTLYDLIIGGEV